MNQEIYHLKLVTLGPLASGKTCLIKRYCEENYEQSYIPTIGVDYGIKYFHTKQGQLALNIFDLSGDDYFESMQEQYFQNCDILIMTIEALKHNHFKQVQEMYQNFKKFFQKKRTMLKILVLTKTDKTTSRINTEQIENFAKKNKFQFFKTSSQYDENVSDIFECIVTNFEKRFFYIQNQFNQVFKFLKNFDVIFSFLSLLFVNFTSNSLKFLFILFFRLYYMFKLSYCCSFIGIYFELSSQIYLI